MTYQDICDKLGFDPIREGSGIQYPDHECDSIDNPYKVLTNEESDFLLDYWLKHLRNKRKSN